MAFPIDRIFLQSGWMCSVIFNLKCVVLYQTVHDFALVNFYE